MAYPSYVKLPFLAIIASCLTKTSSFEVYSLPCRSRLYNLRTTGPQSEIYNLIPCLSSVVRESFW